ncbi:MAG: hypothetical protein Q4P24_15890 [Rhodobacterales bacterium]|nr:hypothetical protein [Rhodobacterales bacterium]
MPSTSADLKLGIRLSAMRAKAGLSQRVLAKLTGVPTPPLP